MLAVLALAVPVASAGARATPADEAATLAYVRADVAFEGANLAALPSAVAAVRAQATHERCEGEAEPGGPIG